MINVPEYQAEVFALFACACEAIAPDITWTRDEFLELLQKVQAIVPDEAAAQRLWEQLAHPLLTTDGHA